MKQPLLLQNVFLNNTQVDVLIDEGRFSCIAPAYSIEAADKINKMDCSGLAIMPPFYNGHCHAPMTLLRGLADDEPLHVWLNDYIWPREAKLTPDHIYAGTRLACLEMIKSGTVFFNDMYFMWEESAKAINQMGLRAHLGMGGMDLVNPVSIAKVVEGIKSGINKCRQYDRINFGAWPHAIYSVSENLLKAMFRTTEEENCFCHIHLAETAKEVSDCQAAHGCTPVEYMNRLGLLNERVSLAHCVHLTDHDREILVRTGAAIVLNCSSNLKLSSGIPDLPAMLKAGIKVALGTDGASSNNCLDMHQEMKTAALLAKFIGGAEAINAEKILEIATKDGAKIFGLNGGEIKVGCLADALLIRLDNERLLPSGNLISNWVYAADNSVIDSVICDGRFLMRNKIIEDEAEIISQAKEAIKDLMAR